ncbi:MAG: glutamine synthetase [Bacteriovoracaceae bacterium]|nr:glutamine synthetase [Bacteriovoracaceae bacterium]
MKMSKEQIIEQVKRYKGEKVKLAITDVDGILRGKVIHLKKFLSIVEGGLGFCNVVFGWDSSDLCYDKVDYTGWHSGYPDANANLDLNTFRTVPWDEDIPFFLADFADENGGPLGVCPRSLLKRIKQETEDAGYSASFAQEFEWFNFRENSEDLNDRGFTSPEPITKGMFGYSLLRASQNKEFFNDLFDLCNQYRVPIEGLHTETGPGVYEAAILYDDILESADRAVLFKAAAKEIGHLHGIIPTFMAKWNDDYPGSSGHVHQSIWKDGKNLFHDASAKDGISETMKSYIAGVLHCMPQLTPMYAPTVNSFKRLVEGAWAPTTLTWGIDNRTVAVRALPGSDKSSRIELRVVGADANPYLAMAATLASGMYGIKNNLKLEVEATRGNGYENKSNGVLPRNLFDAAVKMRESELARKFFGDEFVNHFTNTRVWEWNQYSASITDWERKRYFEII